MTVKKLFEYLNIDLDQYPSIACKFIKREDRNDSIASFYYECELDVNILKIFSSHLDIVHSKISQNDCQTILEEKIFTFKSKNSKINSIHKLIDCLYQILGKDDLGRKAFSVKDKNLFTKHSIVGRIWSAKKTENLDVLVSGNNGVYVLKVTRYY